MRQWKRLFYYLLINILVSACTTLAVLYAWDRSQSPQQGFVPEAGSSGLQAAGPQVDLGEGAEAATPQVTPTPVYTVYQLESNQTLTEIAQQFNLSPEELMAINGFAQDQVLGAGESLLIPPTAIPQIEADVQIVGVVGAGDLGSERVVIRQFGEGRASLLGWQIEDGSGNIYLFPGLELSKDGSQVELFTKAGTDTASTLFWKLDQAIWQPGDTVSLRDATGTLRTSYTIP